MKIVALKERAIYENRAAISPETGKLFIAKGHNVLVEKDIGLKSGFSNEDYINSGIKVSAVPLEIISDADIILKVQPTPLIDQINEIDMAKEGAIIIALLSPEKNKDYVKKLLDKKLFGIRMEYVPRITRAQNMDVLSSQSNLAGYRAVIEACYYYNKIFPMMMTAAGTITPAKILIIGVGVAGLQAIATAKRFGAVVFAYDVRSATKEQVESLGAKFVSPPISSNLEDKGGYAREATDEYKKQQEEFLAKSIKNYDIVITTAQIPGKTAPLLVTSNMVQSLKAGSVIIDMATSSGGNVEGSKVNEIIEVNGVKIIGWSNLAAKIAGDSSKLYAKNLYNFLNHSIQNGKFNFEDDIVKQMLVKSEL